jgi:hypothetical protein
MYTDRHADTRGDRSRRSLRQRDPTSWSAATEDEMEIVYIPLLYDIPVLVTWVVIDTAVLSALRRHDRD